MLSPSFRSLPMAQAVAFGMGGGLLQKVNRDTMSFATKLSHVTYADGTDADIMKSPTGDTGKISFPGTVSLAMLHLKCDI